MSDIKLKFTKLDRRHKGHGLFKYYVDVVSGSISLGVGSYYQTRITHLINFNEFRKWCFDTWGNSCELETYQTLNSFNRDSLKQVELNPHWAWDVYENRSDRRNRIYIMSDKEKAWMDLKWM